MRAFGFEVTKEELSAFFGFLKECYSRLRVPKNRRGRVGIVIALKTEGDKEKQLLESELVRALNQKLEHSSLMGLFYVFRFDEYITAKIESPKDAEKYLRRARAHTIIYGDFVRRQIKGVTNYVFRLEGLVVHRAIPQEISRYLGQEFREFLPSRVTFPEAEELLGFEVTQQWVGHVAIYSLAIAAMLSGRLDIGRQLLTSLEIDLIRAKAGGDYHPTLSKLKQRVNTRYIELLHAHLLARYKEFAKTLDRSHLLASEADTRELLKRNPYDYTGKLQQALIEFVKGNTRRAIESLQDIKSPDPTWRYSMGFLCAYEGRIEDALEHYRRATYGTPEPSVIADTELFITDVLDREPDKIQLYFFRGLINYKAKSDYNLAKDDLSRFLNSNGCDQYPRLVELAKKWIDESESQLGT